MEQAERLSEGVRSTEMRPPCPAVFSLVHMWDIGGDCLARCPMKMYFCARVGKPPRNFIIENTLFRLFEVTILLICSVGGYNFGTKFERVLISWRLLKEVASVQQTPSNRLVF